MQKKDKKTPKFAYQIPSPSNKFVVSDGYHTLHPTFCFKNSQFKHSKFTIKDFKNTSEYEEFFERIKEMSAQNWRDIEKTPKWHAHPIDWTKTSANNSSSIKSAIPEGMTPYQFATFEGCRVIGYHAEKVFRIVFIDRGHDLYPRK